MRLVSLTYRQWGGTPREWRVDNVLFGPINLLVGPNASGKTRILNVISGLANLVSGDQKVTISSGSWEVTFESDENWFEYILQVADGKVVKEVFRDKKTTYLNRSNGGEGQIWAEKLKQLIDIQVPQDELAAVTRRDSIQHPFFESLNHWGNTLYHYQFGGSLGKDFMALVDPSVKREVNPRDSMQVIGKYREGEKTFGEEFKESIKQDMAQIGYPIDNLGTAVPTSIRVQGPQPIALFVKELGLGDVTDQVDMSQGMFRAFSIIIQVNYSAMTRKPSCILIDDIGEGLDFERSCSLIKLLMRKVEDAQVQLIMSTNDRFVMNTVPLETWTVLRRTGPKIQIYNYKNSKERFDQFKFTGMNNFDFFASNFLTESDIGK